MERSLENDYKRARLAAGMTQERWAEAIGVSTESVRLYEGGHNLPSDDVVERMAKAAQLPVLSYWHTLNKCRVASSILPELEPVNIAQAVVRLLGALRSFQQLCRVDELLQIAADGVVSGAEAETFTEILEDLEEIIEGAMAVKFARGIKNAPADAGTSTRAVMVKTMRTSLK